MVAARARVNPPPRQGSHEPERHIETVVSAIRALPADAVAAVVGHTNTIPQIIEGLGGGSDGIAIGETEFDRLFVLSRAPGGFVALVKLRYGAPT